MTVSQPRCFKMKGRHNPIKQMAKKIEDGEGVSAIAVFLVDKYGNESYVRTYSFKDHGENFEELAKEYQEKITKNGAKGILREDKR